jgi:hypothetical protein
MSRLLALTISIFLSQVSPAQQSSTVMNSPDSACGQGANLSGLTQAVAIRLGNNCAMLQRAVIRLMQARSRSPGAASYCQL